MKIKFLILTFLVLFARGCDFYSTSLWFFQENGMSGEMNPLTKIFGVGWTGLIISNSIIIGIIIYLLYYFYFRYQRPISTIEPKNYRELASLQYFNSTEHFYHIFYKMPKNKRVLYAHMGYVLTIAIIIASFLATIHNFSQYYSFNFYNQFRRIVGRPLFVIYGLILLTIILTYRHLLINEYKKYKTNRSKGMG